MNKSRPMAERVSAIQRLTLLPSTDLADVTRLIDDADLDWGTNIKERLIRGKLLHQMSHSNYHFCSVN